MLAAALGLAASGVVSGQMLTFIQGNRAATINEPDKSLAVAYWLQEVGTPPDPDIRWVYTAGYVTERDGSNNPHTRLMVRRFDANRTDTGEDPWPDNGERVFYFPPLTVSAAGQHAATAMVVDDSTGDLYVCGSTTIGEDGQETGTNLNYVVIKLDKDLSATVGASAWTNLTPTYGYARIYDGPAGAEDRAVAVARVSTGDLFITGTSASASHGTDIVTLRLNADGSYDADWPDDFGEADGVRRWDNTSVHGDDSAAAIGYAIVTAPNDGGYTAAYVVGASDWGSAHHDDLQVLAYGRDGKITGSPNEGWERNINGGGSGYDAGTSLSLNRSNEAPGVLYVGGYGAGSQDIDFLAVVLDPDDGTVLLDSPYSFDFGGDDYCVDLVWTSGPASFDSSLWLFGRSEGASDKAAAVVLQASDGLNLGSDLFQYIPGGHAAWNAARVTLGGVVAGGRVMSSVSDTDALLIEYSLVPFQQDPPLLIRNWVLRCPPGNEIGYEEASCLAVDGGTQDIFCGGVTTPAIYGPDFLTLRVSGN